MINLLRFVGLALLLMFFGAVSILTYEKYKEHHPMGAVPTGERYFLITVMYSDSADNTHFASMTMASKEFPHRGEIEKIYLKRRAAEGTITVVAVSEFRSPEDWKSYEYGIWDGAMK